MPAARQIQPMGFPGRLEAIRAPTIGKGRKGNIAHNGVLMLPVPQLLGGRTGRVVICRATEARDKTTQSAASDQASHEVARALIPLTPCSGACFPRSRHYSTVLPSPERYGKRYEVEESSPSTGAFVGLVIALSRSGYARRMVLARQVAASRRPVGW